MSGSRKLGAAFAALALAALALALCCTHGAEPEPASAPVATSGAEAEARSRAEAPARDGDAGTPPATTKNPVAARMGDSDARDRELLRELERATSGQIPAAAHTLIAMRREGASQAELERFAAENLAADLAVRLPVERWLHGEGQPAPSLDETPLGKGGRTPQVAPLTPSGQ